MPKKIIAPPGTQWCRGHKTFLPQEHFASQASPYCRPCKKATNNYRARTGNYGNHPGRYVSNGRPIGRPPIVMPDGMHWCYKHRDFLPLTSFNNSGMEARLCRTHLREKQQRSRTKRQQNT